MVWINTLLKSIITSSRNPQAVSLTVRGLLLQLVPLVMITAQLAGWQQVDENTLTDAVEAITLMVAAALQLVSTFMVGWGLLRKLLPTKEQLEAEFND